MLFSIPLNVNVLDGSGSAGVFGGTEVGLKSCTNFTGVDSENCRCLANEGLGTGDICAPSIETMCLFFAIGDLINDIEAFSCGLAAVTWETS